MCQRKIGRFFPNEDHFSVERVSSKQGNSLTSLTLKCSLSRHDSSISSLIVCCNGSFRLEPNYELSIQRTQGWQDWPQSREDLRAGVCNNMCLTIQFCPNYIQRKRKYFKYLFEFVKVFLTVRLAHFTGRINMVTFKFAFINTHRCWIWSLPMWIFAL